MKQTFTSAATSINKNKLPAIYKKINFYGIALMNDRPMVILDWGCGKYDNAKSFVESNWGANWYGYDKYNRGEKENRAALKHLPDCIICSNLLNVIDSDEEVQNIANAVLMYANIFHTSYFVSVYDGDRSGVGRQTGPDQWQRNEKIQSYLRFFPGAVIKHGVLTNDPENVL